ncbi:hypothetical protein D3C73_1402600 [compost metagenome]
MNDGGLVLRVIQRVHQSTVGLHMFDIERAVGTEVAEGAFRQVQALANTVRGMGRQGDARAFEYVDHAKQSHRIVPGNQVIEEADHQFDRQ